MVPHPVLRRCRVRVGGWTGEDEDADGRWPRCSPRTPRTKDPILNEQWRDGHVDDVDLDHIEIFVGDVTGQAARWCDQYGFDEVARAGSDKEGFRSSVLRQGSVVLVLTEALDARHSASRYVREHGDGIADIALSTVDVRASCSEVVSRGGRLLVEPHVPEQGDGRLRAVVSGFGDVVHTLVERREDRQEAEVRRLRAIDHLAVCVEAGALRPTVDYYLRAFGFTKVFEERIVVGGQAMVSEVVRSRSGTVTFTVIEPDPEAEPGQIDGFLERHGGAGVQHVAFATDDIVRSVADLEASGVGFLPTPGTYHTALGRRITPRRHTLGDLRDRNVLVDEDQGGQMFQIFTRSTHERRTLFYELIERSGASTFGSSNVTALYEAVEAERSVAASVEGA